MLRNAKSSHFTPLIISLLMTPLGGIGIDLYMPSMPAITQHFNVDPSWVQLTISVYLIGFCAQPIFGTLTDTLGRRKPLIIGLCLYLLCTLLIPHSPNITSLLILRFLQGVFVAAPGVVSKALLPDYYKDKQLRKYFNYLTIIWALSPILAPMVGGYLQHYFGWHSPFYFLAAYALILLLLAIFQLPETHTKLHAFNAKQIISNYSRVLKHPIFIGGVICCALVYSFMAVFNVIGPFLIQAKLHYSPITFGHIALLLGLSWFLGNVANRFLMKANIALHHVVINSLICILVISVVSLITVLILHNMTIYTVTLPTLLIFFFAAIVFTNIFGASLSIYPEMAGTVSGALGALLVVGAGIISGLASIAVDHTEIPMMVTYTLLAVFCIMVFVLVLRPGLRKIQ